jgi:hypothetical protein
MANFWDLSDGSQAEQTNTFDSGSIVLIPDNTTALAVIEEASWKTGFEGAPDLISIRWNIVKPIEFKGQKVFQKIKVKDDDAKVSDKSKRMLMAIDMNAGGKLAKLNKEPSDNDLMANLMYKPMVIKIMVWKMNDKEGNWVSAVAPVKAGTEVPVLEVPKQTKKADDFGDVPF